MEHQNEEKKHSKNSGVHAGSTVNANQGGSSSSAGGNPNMRSSVQSSSGQSNAGSTSTGSSRASGMADRVAGIGSMVKDAIPEGALRNTSDYVSEKIQAGKNYFSQKGMQDIKQDVCKVVEQNPMKAMWVGLGVGVLLGSTFFPKRA